MEKQTLMITAVNRPDLLARISGLLSGRALRIESITGGPAKNPNVFELRLVVSGKGNRLGQIGRLIDNLIDTIKVVEVSGERADVRPQARRERRQFPIEELL